MYHYNNRVFTNQPNISVVSSQNNNQGFNKQYHIKSMSPSYPFCPSGPARFNMAPRSSYFTSKETIEDFGAKAEENKQKVMITEYTDNSESNKEIDCKGVIKYIDETLK